MIEDSQARLPAYTGFTVRILNRMEVQNEDIIVNF